MTSGAGDRLRSTRGPHLVIAVAAGATPRELPPDASHHVRTVLRCRDGDPLSLTDGAGTVWQARVAGGDSRAVEVAVDSRVTIAPAQPQVRLLQGLPKGRKFDEIVRRATELGVDRISPVVTARGESRPKAGRVAALVHRWEAVARAAAAQSRRAWLPVIDPPTPLHDVVAGRGVALWERATTPLSNVLADLHADRDHEVTVLVGPEGGLEESEVAAVGLPAAALGGTLLRTETAAVTGLALVLHHLGRLG